MSFYSEIRTENRPQQSLAAGAYGNGSKAALKIIQYIDKASKPDKNGAMQHSFLVVATAAPKGATGDALLDFEGTAFLKVVLHEMWLNPEAIALAFTEASRDKDGKINSDYVAAAIQQGLATQESINKARAYFMQVATDKVLAANTPADAVQAAVDTQYGKEMTQIAIKVGTFFRLQSWNGSADPDPQYDPKQLVNVEFSGKVETNELGGKLSSEVSGVFSKKKGA